LNRKVAVAPPVKVQLAVPAYVSATPVVKPQFAPYWNWLLPVPVTLPSTMDCVAAEVRSARSMAMLVPLLDGLRCPVLVMVRVWLPAASAGLVQTTPEALRPGA